MAKVVSVAVVFGTNGLIDSVASVAQYTEELEKLVSAQNERIDLISNSVHAVFDQYPTVNIEMGTLATLVMNHMQTDPFQQNAMKDHVLNFVRNNADFVIIRGSHGGCRRVSDMANDPPKATK